MSEIPDNNTQEMSTFAYALLENYEVFGKTEDEYELGTRDKLIQYIGGLESKVAELEAAQRWIPVDEKPLEAGVYLVRLKNGVTKIDWTFIDGGIYYWWNSDQDSVTHYMPLPKLPEVQE